MAPEQSQSQQPGMEYLMTPRPILIILIIKEVAN